MRAETNSRKDKQMSKRIYIIWDKLAMDAVGATMYQLALHAHDAAAIRWFSDVAGAKDTAIARHPTDYELHCVGNWDPQANDQITGMKRRAVIFTGEQWLASTQKTEATE